MGPHIHNEDATGVQFVDCPFGRYADSGHKELDLFFNDDVN